MRSAAARLGLLALLLVPAAAGQTPARPKAPLPAPAIRRDSTPVTDGTAPGFASYADVVEPVQKAVVSIYSTVIVKDQADVPAPLKPLFGQGAPRTEQDLGSGVIVSPDGYILTNNHVVADASELEVMLSDDRSFKATVVGTDPKTDIAVVKISAKDLPVVVFADSDKLRVGDVVFAIGNPLNVGETVTMGIISAKGRSVGLLQDVDGYENFIQTDAAINMGNSGGALIDAKGRLIGINSAIFSPSKGSIGIGFAIPANLASNIMMSLIQTGTVSRGFLGVSSEPLTPDVAEQLGLPRETKGVAVTDVTAGTPADKAGIKISDVITTINGVAVTSVDSLKLTIAQMSPGSRAMIQIYRDARPLTLPVTLSKMDEGSDALLEGVMVSALTDEMRRKFGIDPRLAGLVVTEVDPSSPFADAFIPGVVIVEIDRSPVTELAGAQALLKPGHNLFLVNFRGTPRYLVITK